MYKKFGWEAALILMTLIPNDGTLEDTPSGYFGIAFLDIPFVRIIEDVCVSKLRSIVYIPWVVPVAQQWSADLYISLWSWHSPCPKQNLAACTLRDRMEDISGQLGNNFHLLFVRLKREEKRRLPDSLVGHRQLIVIFLNLRFWVYVGQWWWMVLIIGVCAWWPKFLWAKLFTTPILHIMYHQRKFGCQSSELRSFKNERE